MPKIKNTGTDEDLAELIASDLNKHFKDIDKIAFTKNEETPSDLLQFVSTGCTTLDVAISNRPYGGIPFGRITEITGLEQSGKSLLAAHVLANVQKMGGIAVLIDTESAVNWEFFDAVGINREKNWVYAQIETVEDIFEAVEKIIETVRKSSKDKPVVIVIDSMAGASTKQEMEATYDKAGYATGKAILLSMAMRKITPVIADKKIALIITNQLRQILNAMPFGEQWTTSGGKSIAFHASVRLRLGKKGNITMKAGEDKIIVGSKVEAKVIKNRLGPPLRTTEYDIYFDRGIDDELSWLKFLRDREIIDGPANALKYNTLAGEEIKFSEAKWKALLIERPELRDELYQKMCDVLIMSYKRSDDAVLEIEESTSDE